ncbi:unnamed protein product [Ilex paraguariensis]|uniref:BPL/LPL catalytic domain-containing protein n=1 Tax=Ilex paraguariensis TaxID=185542 RepID=A0ABC8T0G6_9AQUA
MIRTQTIHLDSDPTLFLLTIGSSVVVGVTILKTRKTSIVASNRIYFQALFLHTHSHPNPKRSIGFGALPPLFSADQVPVIKRFTGGGTVIVDQGTVFASLIYNRDAVPGVHPYSRSIMCWSGSIYYEV